MGAKDSQLAVLRVRIQESDQELKEAKERLERFQSENERWVLHFWVPNRRVRLFNISQNKFYLVIVNLQKLLQRPKGLV